MTQVILKKTAEKQLERLPTSVQKQILQKLEFVKVDPDRYLEKLKGSPWYKIRVGQYRLVCDIEHDRIIIHVLRIASREVVYKFLKETKF